MTPRAWRECVERYARTAQVTLSPQTIHELAAHLEDIYLAAREEGLHEAASRARARQALETSGLLPLRHEPRVDPRQIHQRAANDTAKAARHRSLAMMYALRMAMRQFRMHPGFTAITILVLGLGTAAAVTVFSVVDTVVLRPLPYAQPERLVKLWDTNHERGLTREPLSPVTFMDYRALPAFEDAAAWWRPDINLVDPGLDPLRVPTIEVSNNLFRLLGVTPQIGPGFAVEEQLFNRTGEITISDRLWRSRYSADPAIVGRQLSLNGAMYTVVGVMPAGFRFPDDIDVWQRLQWPLQQHSRHAHFMEGVAKLADGVTLERARADAATLGARLATEFAASNGGWSVIVMPLLDDQLGYYQPALYVLFGAVGLLLLIACLNVASLLLTRVLSRGRELAVRTALGASPRHIVTQLVAESLVRSVAGAAVGIAIAFIATPALAALTPVDIPRLADVSVNVRVLALSLAVVVAMAMLFGLVPALLLLRSQIATDLRSGDRGSSKGARRIYQTLVVGEVALAAALLVASALLIRTVQGMMAVPLGVDGSGTTLASVQIGARSSARSEWTRVESLHSAILERVRQQPGINAVGATNRLPLDNGWRGPLVRAEDPAPQNEAFQAQHISISEGYFEAMGARLQSGRFFTDRDVPESEPVIILNETAARRYFGNAPPVDRQMKSWSSQIGPLGRNLAWLPGTDGRLTQPLLRVVGVIADVQNVPLGMSVEPAVYFPTRQFPFAAVTLAINARDTATAVAAVKQAIREVTPQTPMGPTDTWPNHLRGRTAEPRLLMSVLGAFAVLAALLAALGVYGLFSWSVALRRRELAIRLTLGAAPASVGSGVVAHSVVLVFVGLVGGLGLVLSVRHLLATVLFSVSPSDPASMVAGTALLFAAALCASLPPAWRAMRVDPVEGLRNE